LHQHHTLHASLGPSSQNHHDKMISWGRPLRFYLLWDPAVNYFIVTCLFFCQESNLIYVYYMKCIFLMVSVMSR
jgi:hypothetical protein